MYEPSSRLRPVGRPAVFDQEVVPVVPSQTSLVLSQSVPFQYVLSELRFRLISTTATPEPVVSLPVPEIEVSALTLAPLAGLVTAAVGAAVSMTMFLFVPSDPAPPVAGNVSVALLPTVSLIVPPLSVRDVVAL